MNERPVELVGIASAVVAAWLVALVVVLSALVLVGLAAIAGTLRGR